MKTVFELSGGLGNQIFQYLASQYIRQSNKYVDEVYFCQSDYLRLGYREYSLGSLLPYINNVEQTSETKTWSLKLKRRLSALTHGHAAVWSPVRTGAARLVKDLHTTEGHLGKSVNKRHGAPLELLNDYLESIGILNCRSVYVSGYWQNITPYIGKIAALIEEVQPTVALLPTELRGQPYIAIHLRRGDFHNEIDNRHFYCKRVSPVSFIFSALSILPSQLANLPIIIVSDDESWAQQLSSLLVDKGVNARLYTCLGIMSDWSIIRYASYRILANSTFSMTAALLGPVSSSSKVNNVMPQWINQDTHAADWGWDLLTNTVLL